MLCWKVKSAGAIKLCGYKMRKEVLKINDKHLFTGDTLCEETFQVFEPQT